MVTLPTLPDIFCDQPSTGKVGIGVVLVYKGSTPLTPLPLSGADVRFRYRTLAGALLWIIGAGDIEEVKATTDIFGFAQACIPMGRAMEVYAQRSGVDFGSGAGAWHKIGSFTTGLTARLVQTPWFEALTYPSGYKLPALPCIGTIDVSVPTITPSPTLPSNIFAKVTTKVGTSEGTALKSVPLKIYFDGKYYGDMVGNQSFDIIRVLKGSGLSEPRFDREHTIKIALDTSAFPNCNIPPVSFSVPALIPAGVPSPCDAWNTVANIDIPSILKFPFDIGLFGGKWECPSMGKVESIDGINAEVLIGTSRFSLPIRGGSGTLSLNQSQIQSLLTGLGAGAVTTPAPAPTRPTGRIPSSSAAQAYLDKYHPGGKVETVTMGTGFAEAGAFQIWRGAGGRYPAGTYFWAIKYEDIGGTY